MPTSVAAAAAAVLLLSGLSSAQHVLFEEDFESGVPSTWTNVHNAAHFDPWRSGAGLVDGSKDVYHESYCTNGYTWRDNVLLSPVIDLSAVTQAFVEFGQVQRYPASRVYNAVEITTDGGQTFSVVYQETGMFTGFKSVKRDISAWAGSATVQLGFHYQGVIANEWSIDNVRVTTSPMRHGASALLQGQQGTYAVSGATAGNSVFLMLSAASGPLPTPWGNLNLFSPIVFFPGMIANAAGAVSVTVSVPAGAAGITLHSQAIELAPPATLRISNSVAKLII